VALTEERTGKYAKFRFDIQILVIKAMTRKSIEFPVIKR
jgi:hypothetical protein